MTHEPAPFDLSQFDGHTPGDWRWFGNASSNDLYLATNHSGRILVMDFKRWGPEDAQPRFRSKGGMVSAKDLIQFRVGNQSVVGLLAAKNDLSVYRYDIRGIDHPDARLIAAAPALLAEVKALRARVAELEGAPMYWDADEPSERPYDSPHDAFVGGIYNYGVVIEIKHALRQPNFFYAQLPPASDAESDAPWEATGATREEVEALVRAEIERRNASEDKA